MRISDWSSDVCSSDLLSVPGDPVRQAGRRPEKEYRTVSQSTPPGQNDSQGRPARDPDREPADRVNPYFAGHQEQDTPDLDANAPFLRSNEEQRLNRKALGFLAGIIVRSEEHTSELQSLMRISYAVFCLKKKIKHTKE